MGCLCLRGSQAMGGEEIGDLAFQAGEAVCVGKHGYG